MKNDAAAAELGTIRIHEKGRYLADFHGYPFFWLGDTAWELFHRLNREEAELYFSTRARQGFTLVQAVILTEFDGVRTPNAYGALPFLDGEFTQPNDAYFSLVDEYVDMAAAYGLRVGLLPTWGDKVTPLWGAGPVVFDTPEKASRYGRFVGHRYGSKRNVLWILGGDRPAVHKDTDYRPIWRAMAQGILETAGKDSFISYHPWGGPVSTYAWLQNEPWLSMHMFQSGHGGGQDVACWDMAERDWALYPPRPTVDGEPNYEDHPISPWPSWNPRNGYYRDYDVRKQCYRSVFAGAAGVTYGHHSVWQFCSDRHSPINHADRAWQDALARPGAEQVRHLRSLILSRPYFSRIPDQSLILSGSGPGPRQIRATKGDDGSYAMVYQPLPAPITLRLDSLSGQTIRVWAYSPLTGKAVQLAEVKKTEELTLSPEGNEVDRVFVLDDASRGFAPPGQGFVEK